MTLTQMYFKSSQELTLSTNWLKDECDIDEWEEYYKPVAQANGQLECEISSWIIACNRTKVENPLAAATRKEIDDIMPEDSISNVDSRVTSMDSEDNRSASQIVSLQVMDLQDENKVEMQCVLARPKLPVWKTC